MDANSSGSTNSSDDDFVFDSYPQQIIIASVLCLVTVVGIIGNSHVVLAVLLCRKLRSPTNWLVVNLGMADLITCLFLPFNVVAMLSRDGWPIAKWTCAMTGAVSLTCLGASVINLALIAHNRYVLLTRSSHTFFRVYSKRNIIIMVMLSWIYPFLLVIVPPIAGLGKLGYSEKYKTCQQDTSLPNSDYYSLLAAVFVIIPVFIIIVVIYVLIYRSIVRHNQKMERKLGESREAGTSSFGRSSVDMSTTWTDYQQDRRNSADMDSSKITPSFLNDVVELPELPNRRNLEDKLKPTCSPNLSLANAAVSQSRNSASNSSEICDSEACDVSKIEVSMVQSQLDKAVSVDDHPFSENLEVDTTSSNSKSVVHASSAVAEGSKSTPKMSRHHINVTKRLSLVVVSFFICFLPFGICVMVPDSDPAVPWANLLIMMNSCINPILYAGTMPLFREVMGCIARCKFQNIPEPVEFVRFCRG